MAVETRKVEVQNAQDLVDLLDANPQAKVNSLIGGGWSVQWEEEVEDEKLGDRWGDAGSAGEAEIIDEIDDRLIALENQDRIVDVVKETIDNLASDSRATDPLEGEVENLGGRAAAYESRIDQLEARMIRVERVARMGCERFGVNFESV